MPLPLKAKARICAQASHEPLARMGLVKLDSPTVQRVGVMLFLQTTVNLGWTKHLRKGDISTAFLQGEKRDVDTRGRLFFELPKRTLGDLNGTEPGCLLEVVKSVYGLPDAPRA